MKGFKVTLIFGVLVLIFLGFVIINPFKPEKHSLFDNKKSQIIGFSIDKKKVFKEEGFWWVTQPRRDWASQKLVKNFIKFIKAEGLVKVDLKEALPETGSKTLNAFLDDGSKISVKLFEQTSIDRRFFLKHKNEFFLAVPMWYNFLNTQYWIELRLGLPRSKEPERIFYTKNGKTLMLTKPEKGWSGFFSKLYSKLNSLKVKDLVEPKKHNLKSPTVEIEFLYKTQKPWKIKIFKKRDYYFLMANQRNSIFQVKASELEETLKKAP